MQGRDDDGEKAPPAPDLSTITFPLDALTWGQIRRRAECDPPVGPLTEQDLERHNAADSLEVVSGHVFELKLAQSAFNEAYGSGEVLSRDEREVCEWTVHTSYLLYGITRGEHESLEMIRRFMDEARRQGEAVRGKAR